MKFLKRLACALLAVVCLLGCLPVSAGAQEDLTPYLQRLVQYYLHYQSNADTEIDALLNYITQEDPGQGLLWRDIMDSWDYHNRTMPVYTEVLPDGLPQDDSLCIVVLGYGLRADGSMKEELVDRLVVGLASALKYPNAYVCVTGGATADNTRDTEAGQMAAWLLDKGLDSSRLILESKSLSTTENALNVYSLLTSQYPGVSSVAVVSSDYHIPWGCTMFSTVSHYKSYHGGKSLQVVANAANATSNRTDTLYSQAWGISIITNIPFNGSAVPAMYAEETTMETLPQAEPPVVEVEEDRSWMVFPAVMIGLAIMILFIPTKKKERKRRK